MSASNGTSGGRTGALRLGALLPERMTVTVERNDVDVALPAYRYGPGCPLSVKAEISQAHDRLIATLEDATTQSEHRGTAMAEYYRTALGALVPGLTYEETDIIAGDWDWLTGMLVDLGFLVRKSEDEEAAEGEADGEESSTTAPSSPTSARRSRSATGTTST